jgi:hypothetical protein
MGEGRSSDDEADVSNLITLTKLYNLVRHPTEPKHYLRQPVRINAIKIKGNWWAKYRVVTC